MNDSDNVISIGDDFRRYPRKLWGSRDRARAAKEEQQAEALSDWFLPIERDKVPDHVMSWQLIGPVAADEARRRRLNLARLEEKNGLRPRRW